MQAGDLRDRITIQMRSTTNDAAGEPTLSWADFAVNICANVTDVSGREYVAGQAVTNAITTAVQIRYRAGVNAAMRVVARGVFYNIEAVIEPENKRREMHLMCVKGAANG